MSARTLGVWFDGVPFGDQSLSLNLTCSSITRSPSGIEFSSQRPLPLFAELEIDIRCSEHGIEEHRRGVVVACDPIATGGHRVCLLYVSPTDNDLPSSTSLSA